MESNALTEAFKDAVCAYSTTEMWYYKVKGDHDNPNSLASALNMNYGQLLTCLKCIGLAKPNGKVSQVFGTWTNILGIGDDDKEAPLLNIFSKNIYIRLGNRQPKQLKLPKAQGKDQQSFAEADHSSVPRPWESRRRIYITGSSSRHCQ